jgi:peptide/nickel transport system substrate-binding protein
LKRTLFLILILVISFSLLLGSCAKTTPSTTTSTATSTATTTTVSTTKTSSPTPTTSVVNKYGGIYRQAFTTGLSTPIGYPAEATPDSGVGAGPALESLISIKIGGIVTPVLATSWTISTDKKSIVLTLRKGVKFHDGSDFNADVCKWNLDLEIAAKRALDWTSVEKVDDYTIRINIPQYTNTALTNLSGAVTQQISKATFDKEGIEYSRWHPVGTGPFIFVEYQRDAKLTYKKNPNYWETGFPYLDGVEWSVIADATVRKLAFQKGNIHQIAAQALEAQALQQEGFPLLTSQGGTFALIPCSTATDSPWSNIKVRQAAMYAINREALVKALGFGFAIPAYQLYPADPLSNLPNLVKTEYNPAKAKQLLADAGYPQGFSCKIHTHTMIVPTEWINAVAAQLKEVGIDATVDFPEVGKYMSDATNGWNDGLMAGAFINAPNNPNTILAMYLQGYYYKSMKRTDAVMGALTASLVTDKPDAKLIQAVIQAITDDVTIIPYVAQINAQIYQKGVHDEGAADYGVGVFVSKYMWLDPSLR